LGQLLGEVREGIDRSKETVMKSKAAIQVEYGGPLVVEEIDIPDPGPNQVTVRNFASGVCYSQVHQLGNPALPRPMGLGHEGSGVVTHVGKEVTHVKEGDHVISTWVPRIPIWSTINCSLPGNSVLPMASMPRTPIL
jgi:D-arabinose 1-dehydrogenase-like Zn-dependent alcohol dehydrogenase